MSTEYRNTAGALVANVDDLTLDVSTPIDLIGFGYAGWHKYYGQNFIKLMENFASEVAPESPVEGMIWYDKTSGSKGVSYYDGGAWINFATKYNASSVQLSRMAGADNIDFTSTGSTNVHTAESDTLVTAVLIVPRSGAAPTGAPASFQIEVEADTGDVADKIILVGLTDADHFGFYQISGVNKFVRDEDVVKINVTTAAGGTLDCDVYLFGKVMGS